jgi:hypothetical protein
MSTETPRKRPHGQQEYRGNGKHEWENVTGRGATQRLRVPGRWLYRQLGDSAMTFVPVPTVVGYAV